MLEHFYPKTSRYFAGVNSMSVLSWLWGCYDTVDIDVCQMLFTLEVKSDQDKTEGCIYLEGQEPWCSPNIKLGNEFLHMQFP